MATELKTLVPLSYCEATHYTYSFISLAHVHSHFPFNLTGAVHLLRRNALISDHNNNNLLQFLLQNRIFPPLKQTRMGGRKQKKKINLDWATKEASVFTNQSVPARNLRKTDLGAVIFGTTHNTINECLSRQLFGLPEGHYSYIKNIKQGLMVFLFNYSDRYLHGIFEAASPGQLNIDQYAWVTDGDDTGYTRYPAQVKIHVRRLCHPLSEEQFQPVIAHNYYESKHFHFELDHDQTKQLVSLFTSSPAISTKWRNLYSSLPAPPKRQEFNAPLSPRVTNQRQALHDNLNQASKVSYAAALGGTGTTTTTASSSQPVGKWSALFTSESGYETTIDDDEWGKESHPVVTSINEFTCGQTSEAGLSHQANTTWDDFPLNQEYEDKGDFVQANTWEESWEENQWVSNDADEAKWDQTCVPNLNSQANTATENVDIMQGNTWDEGHHIATSTCEVEHGQTSDSSDQHLDEPPYSPRHLDDNSVLSSSLRAKTIESDIVEVHKQFSSLAMNTDVETSTNLQPLLNKLMQEFEVIKGSQLKQILKSHRLEQEFEVMKGSKLKLKQELDASKLEIQQLTNRVRFLESRSQSIVDPVEVDDQLPSKFVAKFNDSVLIVGGHDGSSWLPTLDSYFPSRDVKVSLSPMNFIKRYASAATLNAELYHFGGDGSHTVESFNPANNQWIQRPPLYWKNINIAGASVKDRLFVVGGAIGPHCSSEVEYLDMNIGRWLPSRSMQCKRLAPAAAELNNILYVSGGYDGASYSSSVERFDPRDEVWCKLPSMNAKKGCHSMVVLNEKLYTVGGFSGDRYIPTVEYLDTRMGAWVEAEPMSISRGNFGIFIVGGKMYTVGGRTENDEVLDIVECYQEGRCWEVVANMKAIGKRSHFSAFVM
ncbi:hypothetical protein QVD17_35915 [Tagetes erecta]|uniref:DCD domain-containing protein n=1 Tax=Tagetes erecta TaxID=13708 RepID=A0AAD8JRF1_TARER|nr:hypothetical protein QVD17_35915 [Tagetes erecta]